MIATAIRLRLAARELRDFLCAQIAIEDAKLVERTLERLSFRVVGVLEKGVSVHAERARIGRHLSGRLAAALRPTDRTAVLVHFWLSVRVTDERDVVPLVALHLPGSRTTAVVERAGLAGRQGSQQALAEGRKTAPTRRSGAG